MSSDSRLQLCVMAAKRRASEAKAKAKAKANLVVPSASSSSKLIAIVDQADDSNPKGRKLRRRDSDSKIKKIFYDNFRDFSGYHKYVSEHN